MLGGKGDEGGRKNINHKPSTKICAFGDTLKPTCANNTEKILNNIDDVIEFVVNDISGTKTGLDVQNKLNKAKQKRQVSWAGGPGLVYSFIFFKS